MVRGLHGLLVDLAKEAVNTSLRERVVAVALKQAVVGLLFKKPSPGLRKSQLLTCLKCSIIEQDE